MEMDLLNRSGRCSRVLQRTYPDGVPKQDYRPMLIVLGDLLSARNLAQVVAEFTGGEAVVVDNDAAAAISINPPRQERARVRAALEAHGLADLYDDEDEDADA